jgi:hypothetical protein
MMTTMILQILCKPQHTSKESTRRLTRQILIATGHVTHGAAKAPSAEGPQFHGSNPESPAAAAAGGIIYSGNQS